MPSGWWRGAVAGACWSVAGLHSTRTLVGGGGGVTITPRRLLAVVLCCVAGIGLLAAMAVAPTAAQTIDCSSQSTDPDSPLIRDCETLLGLKDQLDPNDLLNWTGGTALGSWDGVGVSSDATSGVLKLEISSMALAGKIPAALGDLRTWWS